MRTNILKTLQGILELNIILYISCDTEEAPERTTTKRNRKTRETEDVAIRETKPEGNTTPRREYDVINSNLNQMHFEE